MIDTVLNRSHDVVITLLFLLPGDIVVPVLQERLVEGRVPTDLDGQRTPISFLPDPGTLRTKDRERGRYSET